MALRAAAIGLVEGREGGRLKEEEKEKKEKVEETRKELLVKDDCKRNA